MFGFAELFLSKGFAVLLPDSRGQGESGGDFPTYGVKETDDVHRFSMPPTKNQLEPYKPPLEVLFNEIERRVGSPDAV